MEAKGVFGAGHAGQREAGPRGDEDAVAEDHRAGRAGEDAAASFRVIVQLMDDWIARRVRSTAGSPEPWSVAAERVRRLASATDGLNLDRKQALLSALFAVQRAAAGSSVRA